MPNVESLSRRGSYNPIISHHSSTKHEEVKRMDHWDTKQGQVNERMLENGDYGLPREEYDLTPDEKVTRTLYQESDIDWKTHSLPSLGRASSDNTLGSASGLGEADCYSIRKSVSRTNKNKKVYINLNSHTVYFTVLEKAGAHRYLMHYYLFSPWVETTIEHIQ